MTERPDCLLDLSPEQLQEKLSALGEPPFRARQLWRWCHQHLVTQPDGMTNLPQTLRAHLQATYTLTPLTPIDRLASHDGQTEKILFRLTDGETIESVLMHYADRHSVCVSTQVGCPIGCTFCATGQSGFTRNLTAGEIIAQVYHFERQLREHAQHVTHIVLMGMGEPLLNPQAVWQAIRTWNHPDGLNIGARRITLSTAGVVPEILRMAEIPLQVGLAVSLHAPDDDLRNQLVPLNRRYPIAELIDACRTYVELTHRRVTFEYALIDHVNDHPAQAHALANLLHGLTCHINLIPLNPTTESPYRPSPRERVMHFQEILTRRGLPTTVRLRRGTDIQAGCGQLRRRAANRPNQQR